MNTNVVGWFEIPVTNMDRAIKFYEEVFDFRLSRHILGPIDMAWFPAVENGSGTPGSLVFNERAYKPSMDGVLTKISEEVGYMALFSDSEGNRIALHSSK